MQFLKERRKGCRKTDGVKLKVAERGKERLMLHTAFARTNQPLQKSRLTKWFPQMSVTLCLLILVNCQDLH